MKQPNILFICADEHTRSALPCYGTPFIKAPNLERIAATGTRFAQDYSSSPLCVPGRSVLISGRYVHETGCWDNGHAWHGDPPGWSHRLRDAGYHTVSIGKNHYRSTEDDNGYDEELLPMHLRWGIGDIFGLLRREQATYRNLGGATTGAAFGPAMMAEAAGPGETNHTDYDRQITEAACRWLQREAAARKDAPWALYVSFVAPHFPLTVPAEFYDLYPHDRIPWPIHYAPEERSQHPVIQALMRVWNYDDFFDKPKLLRARAGYYGLISFLDRNIGLVLKALEDIGQRDDTVIVYTADHGEMLGNKGIWSCSAMYEDSVGVPLLLNGPGVPRGATVTAPTSHVDLFPTLAEIGRCTSDADAAMPGRSLLGLAAKDEPERPVFSEYHAGGSITGFYMLRQGRWKYTYYVDHAPELYDLATDPHEGNDLGQDPAHAAVRARMEAALRGIVDPEAANARAFADQQATIDKHGGADAVRKRGHPGEHSLDRRLGVE